MTQSTTLSEDSLSDEGNVDRWGNPSSPGAFAESPIPEEASFLSSEGFQGDRIQGASFIALLILVVVQVQGKLFLGTKFCVFTTPARAISLSVGYQYDCFMDVSVILTEPCFISQWRYDSVRYPMMESTTKTTKGRNTDARCFKPT